MLPDVQSRQPEISLNLTRVGAEGIRKLVRIEREDKRPVILVAEFDIFVNLPSTRKGVNLSRNFEVIDKVLEEATSRPVYNIENLCREIAIRALLSHEYATRAEISMKSEYMHPAKTPSTGVKTQEMVNILCDAYAWKENGEVNTRVMIGVEVTGITACPCAQEMIKVRSGRELENLGFSPEDIEKILRVVPVATHNQRGHATIKVETAGKHIPVIELISIAKDAMSSGTCEILKREDEYEVVKNAHLHPMFVEDSVRVMARLLAERFPELPDSATVIIRQENEESIHQHNVVGEKIATMGEIRKELGIE